MQSGGVGQPWPCCRGVGLVIVYARMQIQSNTAETSCMLRPRPMQAHLRVLPAHILFSSTKFLLLLKLWAVEGRSYSASSDVLVWSPPFALPERTSLPDCVRSSCSYSVHVLSTSRTPCDGRAAGVKSCSKDTIAVNILASSHFNQLFAGPTSQARLAVVTVMLAMIAAVLKFWILWPCIKWLIGTVAWLARIMVIMLSCVACILPTK
jgi:hypothetical protein